MDTMKFNLMEFRDELNVTVRRGSRWSDAKGPVVIAHAGDFERSRIGEILFTKMMRFCDLTNSDIIDEHDPKCRTTDGLFGVMCDTYPNFDEREIVTLVFFELLQL